MKVRQLSRKHGRTSNWWLSLVWLIVACVVVFGDEGIRCAYAQTAPRPSAGMQGVTASPRATRSVEWSPHRRLRRERAMPQTVVQGTSESASSVADQSVREAGVESQIAQQSSSLAQQSPPTTFWEHELELPSAPANAASQTAKQSDLLPRDEEQVAQLIDNFLSRGKPRTPATSTNAAGDSGFSGAIDAIRRRLTGDSGDELENRNKLVSDQPPPRPRPSDTREVVPFGVRNDKVEVKNIGGNISLVARDAPLKEILAMLARSQKLNLIFSSPQNFFNQGGPQPGNSSFASDSANSDAAGDGDDSPPRQGFASRLISAGAAATTPRPPAIGATPGVAGAGVLGGGIDSNMTVTLEDVPLDTALDTILAVAGFTWTRSQGIILVTPTNGSTPLPPNAQGRTMQVFELDFAIAADLDTAIQGLLSPVGQSFASTSVSNDNRRSVESIVVEDLPRYVDRIAEYISQVDVPPRQVAIQAYILEVELGSTLRHGVNLQYLASRIDPNIRFGTTGFARTTPSQAFFLELDTARLDGLLDVLRTTVDAKTLASPRLIAVNGQESRLQVGEQLGFRITTTTQTSTLESVQFLNVGVVLSVTPRISRDGRVLLNVKPEVSSGQVNPETGLPEEETAELQTDVLLDDGQGIVVGGLIKEDMNTGQSKVPVIGDVPYLGALFENRSENRSRTEIIVALVPKVLPLDGERQAQEDFEFERARTPLMQGSLVENPRPYEPSLPDPLRAPTRKYNQKIDWKDQTQAARYGYEMPPRSDVRTSAIRQATYEDAYEQHQRAPHHHGLGPHGPRLQNHSPANLLRRMKVWSKQ